ncbi:MAG: hypothetical protein HeimC3_25070 [Candidatus Heimdallarchaeota archaeon LC_3]|nr:MAG: hypothetical protein HeimC3_25070 [Candidatus Heimdallarchaeota archaeon LC_3]
MEPIEILKNYFDIPEEWALVYYQLWQQGPSPIGEFYKKTGFTRQKVYTLLDKLVKDKFVSVVQFSNKGNIYKCVLPDDLVSSFIHQQELRLEGKRDEKEKFLKEIFQFSPENNKEISIYKHLQIDIISGDNAGELLSSLIDETLYSFKLAIHDVGMGLMSKIQPAVLRAFERKTTNVSMLLSKNSFVGRMREKMFTGQFFPQNTVHHWVTSNRLKIKLSEEMHQNFLLFDNINAVLIFPSENKINFCLKASVDDLSRHFLSQFDRLWKNSDEFKIPI